MNLLLLTKAVEACGSDAVNQEIEKLLSRMIELSQEAKTIATDQETIHRILDVNRDVLQDGIKAVYDVHSRCARIYVPNARMGALTVNLPAPYSSLRWDSVEVLPKTPDLDRALLSGNVAVGAEIESGAEALAHLGKLLIAEYNMAVGVMANVFVGHLTEAKLQEAVNRVSLDVGPVRFKYDMHDDFVRIW